MSTNQKRFLEKIRKSLRQSLLPDAELEHPGLFQDHSVQADASVEMLTGRFQEELEALSGQVHILEDIEDTAPKILEILQRHQARRILAWDNLSLGPPDLLKTLEEAGVTIEKAELSANGPERKAQLAAMDDVVVGLTGAQGGLADTGAIIVLSGPGRGRLASLLPPVHIAVLPRSRLYPSLSSFLSAHRDVTRDGSNLVLIAGPSRSGDIELTLSMGVHGPGEVHVIIAP